MIREIRPSDVPKLKELSPEFEWKFGRDFLIGLVYADEQNQPVMFAGAWSLAEVHMATDHKWSTPGARMVALEELHEAMRNELFLRAIGQAVTWFEKDERFQGRMQELGWVRSQKTSWHKEIA